MTHNTNRKKLSLSSPSSVDNFHSDEQISSIDWRLNLDSGSAESWRKYCLKRREKEADLLHKLQSKSDTSLDKRGLTTNGPWLNLVVLLKTVIAFLLRPSYTFRNKEISSCSRHMEDLEMFETKKDEQKSGIMATNEPIGYFEETRDSSKKSAKLKKLLRENKKGVTLEEAQNSTAKGTTSSSIPFESNFSKSDRQDTGTKSLEESYEKQFEILMKKICQEESALSFIVDDSGIPYFDDNQHGEALMDQRQQFDSEKQFFLQKQEQYESEIAELKEVLKKALTEAKNFSESDLQDTKAKTLQEVYQRQIKSLTDTVSELEFALSLAAKGHQPLSSSDNNQHGEALMDQSKQFDSEKQSLLQIQEQHKNEIAELKEALTEAKANTAGIYERIQIEKSQLQMELSAARADVEHNILLARKKEEETAKVVQEAQCNCAEQAKALEMMQSQLDSRTNDLQMMAVTCESHAAEINELKAQNERLQFVPNTMFQHATEEGPLSLPNFGNNSSTVQQLNKKIEEQEAEIRKLTNINVRWQEHDKKRVAQMNKLKEKYEKEIAELKAEIRSFTNSNQAVVFNEVQQERVDNYLQRLRRREDETREQLEAAVMDAQRQAEVAKQQMEDASRKATEQETRAEELNAKAASLSQQLEELRAALVVATRRHNSPNPPDQQTINNLKEKARRHEQKYLKMSKDYQRVLDENTKLLAHLHDRVVQNRIPPGLFETIFGSRSSGESLSSQPRSQNVDPGTEGTAEEPPDLYDDIEVDSPSIRPSAASSSISSRSDTTGT